MSFDFEIQKADTKYEDWAKPWLLDGHGLVPCPHLKYISSIDMDCSFMSFAGWNLHDGCILGHDYSHRDSQVFAVEGEC